MKPSLCVLLLALLICPFAQAEDVEWVWYAVPDVDNIHAVQILDDNPIAQFAVASEDGFTVYGPLSNWIPLLEDVEVHSLEPLASGAEPGLWIGGVDAFWYWEGNVGSVPVARYSPSPNPITAIAASPIDPQLVLVRTLDGVFRSPDGGLSWDHVFETGGSPSSRCLAFNHNGERVLTVDDGEVMVSLDAGLSWELEDMGADEPLVTAMWRGNSVFAASFSQFYGSEVVIQDDPWPADILDLFYLEGSVLYVANTTSWISAGFIFSGCGYPDFEGPSDDATPRCFDVAEPFATLVGMDGSVWYTSNSFAGSLGAVNDASQPSTITLAPVYPNPFNGSTTVPLSLDAPSDVAVTVTNLLGQRVARLHNGPLDAGTHTLSWNATTAHSGSYLLQIRTSAGESYTQRITLIR